MWSDTLHAVLKPVPKGTDPILTGLLPFFLSNRMRVLLIFLYWFSAICSSGYSNLFQIMLPTPHPPTPLSNASPTLSSGAFRLEGFTFLWRFHCNRFNCSRPLKCIFSLTQTDDATWPTIVTDYCNGSRQSPIDIISANIEADLGAFTFTGFDDNTTMSKIKNTGKTGNLTKCVHWAPHFCWEMLAWSPLSQSSSSCLFFLSFPFSEDRF